MFGYSWFIRPNHSTLSPVAVSESGRLQIQRKNSKNKNSEVFRSEFNFQVIGTRNRRENTIAVQNAHFNQQETSVSFSPCQRNLIKTFQIEVLIAFITKYNLQ